MNPSTRQRKKLHLIVLFSLISFLFVSRSCSACGRVRSTVFFSCGRGYSHISRSRFQGHSTWSLLLFEIGVTALHEPFSRKTVHGHGVVLSVSGLLVFCRLPTDEVIQHTIPALQPRVRKLTGRYGVGNEVGLFYAVLISHAAAWSLHKGVFCLVKLGSLFKLFAILVQPIDMDDRPRCGIPESKVPQLLQLLGILGLRTDPSDCSSTHKMMLVASFSIDNPTVSPSDSEDVYLT